MREEIPAKKRDPGFPVGGGGGSGSGGSGRPGNNGDGLTGVAPSWSKDENADVKVRDVADKRDVSKAWLSQSWKPSDGSVMKADARRRLVFITWARIIDAEILVEREQNKNSVYSFLGLDPSKSYGAAS